jgi:hypothetical protein
MAQQRIYKQPQPRKRDDGGLGDSGDGRISRPSGESFSRPSGQQYSRPSGQSVYDDHGIDDIDKVLAESEAIRRGEEAPGKDQEEGQDQSHEQKGQDKEKQSQTDSKEATPAQLKDAEGNPLSPEKEQKKTPFYKGKNAQSLAKHGLKGFLSKHKKKLIIGGAGIGGAVTLLLLLLFIAGTLLLPNFLQNTLVYRFATSVRSYRQANEQVLSKKLAMDKMPDQRFGALRQRLINIGNKYSEVKKTVLLEKYRPKAVVNNMVATGALDFEESTKPTGIFKRKVTTAIIVNGERIPLADRKWYRPFANLNDSFRLSADVDNALLLANRGNSGIVGTFVRTGVGAQILAKVGVRGLFAWANKGREYKGMTPRQADIKFLQEKYSRVVSKPRAPSVLPAVNSTATEANEKTAAIVREGGKGAEEMSRTGNQPAATTQIMERGLGFSVLAKVTSVLSTANALGYPACLIWQASLQQSGPTIDARMNSLQTSFMMGASGAHQQMSGDTTGEAVGATFREMNRDGGYARSNINQTANGGSPDTTQSIMPPQGSAAGDFTILNVLMPEGAAQVANGAADTICPAITDLRVALGLAAVELIAGFFTGGTYTAAKTLGTAGVARAFTVYLGNFAKTLVTKKFVKRYVKQAGTIAGLALLARMITEQQSGDMHAYSVGEDVVNERDAGGVLYNQEVNRQVLGGRPQTSAEAAESNREDRQDIQHDMGKQSVFERYLNVNNSQSLAARTVINVGTSVNMSIVGNFLNMLAKILNPANIASFFANAFGGNAKALAADAAGRSMYQIVPMGFSRAEARLIDNRATYWDVAENDFMLMEQNGDKYEDIKEEYGKCFTETMGTLLAEQHIVRNADGSVVEDQGLCSPRNLGTNNPKYGDLVFRWRISMRADNVLQSNDEIANPGQATTAAASGSNTINGDVKGMAATLLQRADAGQIQLTSPARSDLQSTANGTPISYCGTIQSIHPGILTILVKVSDPASPNYYKMSINNFANGHGNCRGSLHEKGRAVDIQHIYSSSNQMIGSWGPDANTGEYRSENPAVATAFVTAIAAVMPPGSNMNQFQCAAVKAANFPPGIKHTFMADPCHHIHIDMQDIPF